MLATLSLELATSYLLTECTAVGKLSSYHFPRPLYCAPAPHMLRRQRRKAAQRPLSRPRSSLLLTRYNSPADPSLFSVLPVCSAGGGARQPGDRSSRNKSGDARAAQLCEVG